MTPHSLFFSLSQRERAGVRESGRARKFAPMGCVGVVGKRWPDGNRQPAGEKLMGSKISTLRWYSLERVLALAAAALCVIVSVIVWALVSQQQADRKSVV